jgi:CheY-like chemotaxis protein
VIGVTPTEAAALRGRRILVVEDEYMVAEEIADMLSNASAETIGPVAFVSDAEILVATEDRIDGALLDVNLHGDSIWPVVDTLLARGIPVLLVTGYDASAIPQAYVQLPRREKPTGARDLTRALAQLLTTPTGNELHAKHD